MEQEQPKDFTLFTKVRLFFFFFFFCSAQLRVENDGLQQPILEQ